MLNNSIERAGASVLLRSRFRYADVRLFFAVARLYGDRIELAGWRWSGRHRRTLPLDRIVRVHWLPERSDGINLILHLNGGEDSGETLGLHIKGAGLWKYQIEEATGALAQACSAEPQPLAPERWRKAG